MSKSSPCTVPLTQQSCLLHQAGVAVEVTAVDRPDINVAEVKVRGRVRVGVGVGVG